MKLKNLFEDKKEVTMKATDHFITNIETDTIKNRYFRKVLYTTKSFQLVLMSIEPKSDIGMETHKTITQFIRVEKGTGKAIFNGKEHDISDGSAFVIPNGTEHNIINTSNSNDLKIYSIYSPPNHTKNTIHKTKEDAEKDDEHFDGKTDVK